MGVATQYNYYNSDCVHARRARRFTVADPRSEWDDHGHQSYTYDGSGRVATLNLDGLETFTYTYRPGTNTVAHVDVSYGGSTVMSTAYGLRGQH